MAVQTKQVEFSKETDDCFVLLLNIIRAARAGKPIGEIAAGELPDFLAAMSGFDQIGGEAQQRKVLLQTIGYRTGELADAFLPAPAAPAVPVQL